MAQNQNSSGDIEVGAVDGELRYWLAKEAARQGEGRLNAQSAIRAALEARATALTGWSAVSLLAATGAVFTVVNTPARLGALAAGSVLFIAAILGIHAVRPRPWSMVGYDPLVIVHDTLTSELEVLESIGAGLSEGIQANNLRLNAMGLMLRWAGWLLILAPVVGIVVYENAEVITSWYAVVLRRFQSGPA